VNAAPAPERTAAPVDDGYRPFPNVPRRNTIQEDLEIPALVRLLDVPTGQRVLEVGCGRGVALPRLGALLEPALLVGVDVDEELLAGAERTLIDTAVAATLVRADVRSLPFEDGSFDLVFDFGTCYHIARPEEALREISRVLRAGGRFVHETRVAQLVAHPTRFSADGLPWRAAPHLLPTRRALFWASRTKT
jgi:SAM-dependent methyltransferase